MKYTATINKEWLESHSSKYKVILADPPWTYNQKPRGNSDDEYSTMSLEQLAALPITAVADTDCVLFMWATFPLLPEAVYLMKEWGFLYKTGLSWHKKTRKGKDYFGNGFIFRSAAELLLVGYKGHPKPLNKSTRNSLDAVCLGHSIKPEASYRLIEKLFEGPYLELFARRDRKGWNCVGNEVKDNTRLF